MNLSLEYIRQLTSGNEGVDVEFKETTGQLNRGMETLCGMINGKGGVVVFGVSNKGIIVGQNKGDKTTREIGEALNKFEPAVDLQPVYIRLKDTDRFLIAFQTDGLETEKPYLWDGKPYQRYDSVTSVMPREKFLKLHEAQHGLKYKWENEVNRDLGVDDLDDALILNVIQSAVRRGRLPNSAQNDNVETALKRLKLVKNGHLCNSAGVLFGTNLTDYPQCRLRLARFRGTSKQDFIDNRQEEGNIFQLVDAAMSFFFKHLNLSGTTRNRIVRADELEIPYDALRESVVNAYCHRNWGYETATVGIAIYNDRIVIENAGRFPARISPNILVREEDENSDNTSLPPNPTIANVMYLGGLIEHWGRGLSLMAKECERVGLPAPKFNSDGITVRTVFTRPDSAASVNLDELKDTVRENEDTVKDIVGHSKGHSNTVIDKAKLRLIKSIGEDWYTAGALCEIMGLTSKSSFIRNYIKPCVIAGLVALETPETPTAPNQRYGLTTKGKSVYYNSNKYADPESEGARNGFPAVASEPLNDPQSRSKNQYDSLKPESDSQKDTVIKAIKEDDRLSRIELAAIAGCSVSTIRRRLRDWNIAWLGHPKNGHWVFIKDIR